MQVATRTRSTEYPCSREVPYYFCHDSGLCTLKYCLRTENHVTMHAASRTQSTEFSRLGYREIFFTMLRLRRRPSRVSSSRYIAIRCTRQGLIMLNQRNESSAFHVVAATCRGLVIREGGLLVESGGLSVPADGGSVSISAPDEDAFAVEASSKHGNGQSLLWLPAHTP